MAVPSPGWDSSCRSRCGASPYPACCRNSSAARVFWGFCDCSQSKCVCSSFLSSCKCACGWTSWATPASSGAAETVPRRERDAGRASPRCFPSLLSCRPNSSGCSCDSSRAICAETAHPCGQWLFRWRELSLLAGLASGRMSEVGRMTWWSTRHHRCRFRRSLQKEHSNDTDWTCVYTCSWIRVVVSVHTIKYMYIPFTSVAQMW